MELFTARPLEDLMNSRPAGVFKGALLRLTVMDLQSDEVKSHSIASAWLDLVTILFAIVHCPQRISCSFLVERGGRFGTFKSISVEQESINLPIAQSCLLSLSVSLSVISRQAVTLVRQCAKLAQSSTIKTSK